MAKSCGQTLSTLLALGENRRFHRSPFAAVPLFAIQRPMAFALFIFLGTIIGLLARATLPGCRKLSALLVLWLGIAGAVLGALVAGFVTLLRPTEFHAAVILGSIAGAIAMLAAGGGFRGLVRPSEPASEKAATRRTSPVLSSRTA
jgi:uncharacterized membrane protein YeaQ/YmgE (transglycosylase-associated protein family)